MFSNFFEIVVDKSYKIGYNIDIRRLQKIGRRGGFKIHCCKTPAGSSPALGTIWQGVIIGSQPVSKAGAAIVVVGSSPTLAAMVQKKQNIAVKTRRGTVNPVCRQRSKSPLRLLNPYICPDGGIGRRGGLKIHCRKTCGFKSRSGHQILGYRQAVRHGTLTPAFRWFESSYPSH